MNHPEYLVNLLSGKNQKVLVIGELHGTNEVPQLILGLAERLNANGRKVLLLLEMPVAEKEALHEFFRHADSAPAQLLKRDYWQGEYYGTTSLAIYQMLLGLRSIRDAGGKIAVEPFDNRGISNQELERAMAESALQLMGSYPSDYSVIIHTGNYHSPTKITADSPSPRMGTILREVLGERVVSLEIHAKEGGKAWGCIADEQGEFSSRIYDVASSWLPFEIGSVHELPPIALWDLLLMIERFSPSPNAATPFHSLLELPS